MQGESQPSLRDEVLATAADIGVLLCPKCNGELTFGCNLGNWLVWVCKNPESEHPGNIGDPSKWWVEPGRDGVGAFSKFAPPPLKVPAEYRRELLVLCGRLERCHLRKK